MDKQNGKVYAFWIGLCEMAGVLSGLLSMNAMQSYNAAAQQPSFSPPAWVFPVVWTILFAWMGISAARVSLTSSNNLGNWGLNLFVAQLAVNFFWPLFFFNLQAFGFSLFWLILLWTLVLLTILQFRRVDEASAWLLAPYLAWLTYAAVLNAAVWILNM